MKPLWNWPERLVQKRWASVKLNDAQCRPVGHETGDSSLVPHKELDFDEKGRVLVNGKDSSGLENRVKIIESAVSDSIAIHYNDFVGLNKAGRRERLKGKKLIYIYHDTIDAMGDKASTEIYTFQAAERAIDELYYIVKLIRDDLSGTNIYITSDHGFLYQQDR